MATLRSTAAGRRATPRSGPNLTSGSFSNSSSSSHYAASTLSSSSGGFLMSGSGHLGTTTTTTTNINATSTVGSGGSGLANPTTLLTSRPAILLEFVGGEPAMLRIGFMTSGTSVMGGGASSSSSSITSAMSTHIPRPKHCLPLPSCDSIHRVSKAPMEEHRKICMYYRHYIPLLQQALDRLGMSSPHDLRERVCVVLLEGSGCPPFGFQSWQRALQLALLETLQFAALHIVQEATLTMTPFNFCTLVAPTLIVLHLCSSAREVQATVFSAGHALEYTHQIAQVMAPQEEDNASPASASNPFIDASMDVLLQCLHTCPRECRKQAVQNIVVVSLLPASTMTAIQPQQIARRLYSILSQPQQRKSEDDNEKSTNLLSSSEATTTSKDLADNSMSSMDQMASLTHYPVDLPSLKPLADSVGVVEWHGLRPDCLAWIGANIWLRNIITIASTAASSASIAHHHHHHHHMQSFRSPLTSSASSAASLIPWITRKT